MRGITYFLGGLATLAVSASAFAYEKIGVVGAANGEVTAVRDGKSVTVKPGDAVFLNDVFETGASSEAQLIFLDRSTLSLTPRSKLTVDNYVYNPASKDGEMNVQGMKGVFRFVGGALSKNHPVNIKTPVATIGIRGGIAQTSIADNGATDAVFVYGDALTLTNQSGQTITTTDFGTGLQLDTATGVPGSLPSAVVASRLVDATANIGIGSTPETQKLAPSTSVDSNLNFGGDGSASSSGNSDGASAPAASGGESGSSTPAEGGSGNADASTTTANTTATETTSTTASAGLTGTVTQPLPPVVEVANISADVGKDAVTNAVRTNPDIIIGGGTTPPAPPASGPVAGPAPAPALEPAPVRQVTDTGGGGSTASADTHAGRYVLHSWSGAFAQEPGAISSHTDGTNFQVVARPDNPAEFTQNLSLPQLTTPNAATLINVFAVVDENGLNDYFVGKGYSSFGGAMQYYQLNESDSAGVVNYSNNDDQVNIVQGIRVADIGTARANSRTANGGLVASDVRFYDFLPDLTALRRNSPSLTDTVGFFDYSPASASLMPGYYSASHAAPFGMAVNWATGRYISGFMDFDSAQSQYLKVSFGEVDNAGATTDQYLKGFSTKFFTDGATATTYNGTNKVGKDIFATDGGPIAGMVIDYNLQTNMPSTVSGSQAAVLSTNQTAALDAVNAATSQNHKGFAAGIVSEGGVAPMRYHSTNINDVSFNTDVNGNVSSSIKLHEGDAPVNTVQAHFGQSAGKSSAYLGKGLYASQQGLVEYSATGAATSGNGAMVAGKTLSGHTIANRCNNCQYTSWGVWAGEATGTNNGAVTDFFHMVPYIEGRVTSNDELAALYDYGNSGALIDLSMPENNVPYYGRAYANVFHGGDIKNTTGTANALINLQTRNVVSVNIGLAGAEINATNLPINTSGLATFGTSSNATGWIGTPGNSFNNGNIKGALFGPRAEEVGGNFEAKVGSSQLGGVYHGAR